MRNRFVHVITGAGGYLGAALVKKIRQREPESTVISLDRSSCDLLSQSQTFSVFRGFESVDYIYHLAEVNGNYEWSISNCHDQLVSNIMIHTNVISAWTKFHPTARFIAANSAWSYPEDLSKVTEGKYFCGSVNKNIRHFALGKHLLVLALSTAAAQHHLRGSSLILGTVYGPGDESDHLIPTIFKKIKSGDNVIQLKTSGVEKRDFIYVDDQALGMYLHRDIDTPVLNISSGIAISVRDVVAAIVRLTKYEGRIIYDAAASRQVSDRIIDTGLVQSLTGWPKNQRLKTLEEGLRSVLESIQS